MKHEAIEASIAASGAKATYGGASVGLLGWLMQSNLLSLIGAGVAIAGFAVNWYYRWRQDKREEEAHRARMAQMSTFGAEK